MERLDLNLCSQRGLRGGCVFLPFLIEVERTLAYQKPDGRESRNWSACCLAYCLTGAEVNFRTRTFKMECVI